MHKPYDYRNCQSLFGYALNVHKRSGCVCQFCGCSAGEQVDFDVWRQMSVEHIIGRIKGGDVRDVRWLLLDDSQNCLVLNGND